MKKLKLGFKRSVGRSRGKISSYHRSRGSKKLYRIIDFGRTLANIKGKICFIKKDVYRTSYIAGIAYTNGIFSYMLAAEGMCVGDIVFIKRNDAIIDNEDVPIVKLIGNSYILKYVNVGEKVYNLEFFPGSGGKIARSAGTFVKLIKKYKKTVLIKLTSGEFRLFFLSCMCTIGRVSNMRHSEFKVGKAGVNINFGWRPVVRGRAMNPVDHPHGGRTNGGIIPRTPWGFLTRGVKTVTQPKAQIVKKRIK